MEVALVVVGGTAACVALFMIAFSLFMHATFPIDTPPGEA
jgi:hypothetical protein